ncbi:MAG: YHS domain-containing (seleno)protein [Pseudomonadota bacterium]
MKKVSLFCSLFLSVTLAACSGGEPRTEAELTRQGPDGVALDGYSPVSYFTRGKAERGDPQFAVTHNRVTYHLANADQVDAFNADPARFIPAHGGWCSLMLSGSGNLTPANPESFKIVDDRLLLFWAGDFNGQPVSGLANWETKFSTPQGEREVMQQADNTWQALLDGRRGERVLFFHPEDADRVNGARREAGKHAY